MTVLKSKKSKKSSAKKQLEDFPEQQEKKTNVNVSKKKSDKKSNKKSNSKYKINKKTRKSKNPTEKKVSHCGIIHLDNVISSTLCPSAEKAYKKNFGKLSLIPSEREKFVKTSKDYLLKLCNAEKDYSIFFTSGEIESNRIFLCSAVNAYKKIRKVKPHIVVSSVEHESMLKYANSLRDSGQIDLTYIKPNIYGCILSEHIDSAIKPNTCCVSITYINHELGSVNNIEKISKILHEKRIPLHTDCTYLFGKHKLDMIKTNIDSATISFDKINGPVGLGAIIIKNDLLEGYQLYDHSSTLDNKRTQNIPAISSAIESVKYSLINRKAKNKKLLKFRKEIINKLSTKYQLMSYSDYINSDMPPLETAKSKNKLIVLGPPTNNESYYTPSILSLALINSKGKTGENIKKELEKKNIIIGVPDVEKNYIYNEIKMPKDVQNFIIRISLSDYVSQVDINKFINDLKKLL